jgi:nitroreductase
MTDTIDLLEGLSTTRSIRRFRPDPIPDDLLRSVLRAATWAPSGGNNQSLRLLVVRDPEKRRQIGELYRACFFEAYPPEILPGVTDPVQKRMLTGAVDLAEHLGTEPPVLVLFCQPRPAQMTSTAWSRGSSVYPAVQNLLLAARASGLGGCLTTVHIRRAQAVKAIVGIPDGVDTFALVPLGYPRDKFGPLHRRPVEEVSYVDTWAVPLVTV